MFVKCQLDNGEKFDRYITGDLEDPSQIIEIRNDLDHIADAIDMVIAYPTENTDIKWRDPQNNLHISRLYKDSGFATHKKFINK